ncbi:MAG TPA: GYF domain-containing protein [Candidatus Angelobacter sp.]|nr:GYF domain-containing protein [Candidatus Angelobacter sp.]
MKYYIKRDLNEYGPYTLAELQRYVAQGNISLNDLTRSDGMTEWVPVSQVIGNVPAAPSPQPAVPATPATYAATPAQPAAMQPAIRQPGMAPPQGAYVAQAVPGPVPPDFHWALVLVIGFFCGIFQIVWMFIEATFVKKIRPQSNFMTFFVSGLVILMVCGVALYVSMIAFAVSQGKSGGGGDPGVVGAVALLFGMGYLVGVVLAYVGVFKMRSALVEYYNTVEPINLRLSGVMTFFFWLWYFQYHFSRIAQWKKTGILQPQG